MTSSTPEPNRPRRGRPKGRFRYSKRVVRAARDARSLASSIEVHKEAVAAGVVERLAPELAAGEAMPDHALTLELVGRSVESALERLRASERLYLEAQARCSATRRESEQLARGEVYGQVVAVRRLIDSQFGKRAAFEIHGMKGKTRRKARRLHLQLEALVHALEDRDWPLPEPLLAGAAGDRGVWLRQIEPGYRRLSGLLDELLHRELLIEAARVERNARLQAFDAAYGDALRLVQATLAFAGCGGMLKKLRSYVQRRLLSRRARDRREARKEGRLGKVRAAVDVAKSSLLGWFGRRAA